jgi:NAD(P)H-dependent FMN reductase
MTSIAIIVGSTRPGRKAADVAAWVHGIAAQRSDAEFEIVDLADFELPVYDEPVPPSMGAPYTHAHTQRWSDAISRFDGYVVVTPEYNHSVPGALKNALDFLYPEWNDKAAGFVSYGVAGGTRAVEHLRAIMGELKVADVRAQVGLSLITDFENWSVLRPADQQVEALGTLLDQVVSWSSALRAVREARDLGVERPAA